MHAIEHLYDPLKSLLVQSTQAFSTILLRYTSLNHLSLTVQTMFLQSSRLVSMSNDLVQIDFSDLHEQINWLIDCDLDLLIKIEQCFKNLFQCQTMLTIHNWSTFIDALLDDHLLNVDNPKEYSFHARQFLLKTNFYCSLVLRELTLQHGTSLGSFHLLQLFIEEYLYYRLEQKISFFLNQSVLQTVIENHEQQRQQQNFLANKTYDDDFQDDDIDDDLDSLSDDLNEPQHLFKALSPLQTDEFILPSDTVDNAFSYIFEDLQPLSNDLFWLTTLFSSKSTNWHRLDGFIFRKLFFFFLLMCFWSTRVRLLCFFRSLYKSIKLMIDEHRFPFIVELIIHDTAPTCQEWSISTSSASIWTSHTRAARPVFCFFACLSDSWLELEWPFLRHFTRELHWEIINCSVNEQVSVVLIIYNE